MIDSKTEERILIEVTLGKEPVRPGTPEEKIF